MEQQISCMWRQSMTGMIGKCELHTSSTHVRFGEGASTMTNRSTFVRRLWLRGGCV